MKSRSSTRTTAPRTSRPSRKGTIGIKRAYDPPAAADGRRVLVDRVWPRGIAKDELRLDAWYREVAPSTELRKWFGHDPQRWTEFRKRYTAELRATEASDALSELAKMARDGKLTLIYGARDEEHNQAVVLRDFLERRVSRKRSS